MNKYITALKIFLTVLFSVFCISVWAQVSCTAKAPSEVGVGQAFRYQVTLNEEPSKMLSTNFADFDVLNGPSQSFSSNTSIMNGKVTRSSSYTFTYTLAANKVGSFTIPGVVFSVNGNQVKSNAVTINVVEGGGNGGGAAGGGSGRGQSQQRAQQSQGFDKRDVFVKAYCSNSNPYVGEQVIITHKLYVGPSVNGGYQVTSVNAPTQSGLWSYG